MVDLGTDAGVRTVALLTDMATPLGPHRRQRARGARVGRGARRRRPGRRRRADARAGPGDARPRRALTGRRPGRRAARTARAMDVWRRMIARPGRRPRRAAARGARDARGRRAGRRRARPGWTRYAVGVAAWRLGAGRARKEDPVQAGAGRRAARQAGRRGAGRGAAAHAVHRRPASGSGVRSRRWRARIEVDGPTVRAATRAGPRRRVSRRTYGCGGGAAQVIAGLNGSRSGGAAEGHARARSRG